MSNYKEQKPLAYKLEAGYFYIQECDSGYDYTCYTPEYAEIDGGQLDNPEFTIEEAAIILMKEYFQNQSYEEINAYVLEDIVEI